MFANEDFSIFSQDIGLASLGANDQDLKGLAAVYWFTLEFGMAMQDGKRKAYGAGILGSIEELNYCVTDKPKFYPLDIDNIITNFVEYPI